MEKLQSSHQETHQEEYASNDKPAIPGIIFLIAKENDAGDEATDHSDRGNGKKRNLNGVEEICHEFNDDGGTNYDADDTTNDCTGNQNQESQHTQIDAGGEGATGTGSNVDGRVIIHYDFPFFIEVLQLLFDDCLRYTVSYWLDILCKYYSTFA